MTVVPTPDKLINMVIKTRALSHLGLPAETGFSLKKSHWGKGWVDEGGDARALTDSRGVCAQLAPAQGAAEDTAQPREMAKQQRREEK